MTDRDILEILVGLSTHQVAVIEAGTGTGKSTFMPFRLMNPPPGAPLHLSRRGPIVVTEPRRAAAKSVSLFVGEELSLAHNSRTCAKHIGPGFSVGYQVSGEKHWDAACRLLYVTDGTMINWVRDGRLAHIGAVIIDEAHERSENIDIILAQLRDKVRQYPHLRVIVTSATLDKTFFVEYFGGPDRVFHLSVPPKKTFGYGVPLFVGTTIDEGVIAGGITLGAEPQKQIRFEGWSAFGPELAGYPPEDLHETTRHLEKLRCIEPISTEDWKKQMPLAVASQIVAIAEGTEWGDILGFLPTTETIELCVDHVAEELAAHGRDGQFDIYPLLASTDKNISEKATAARSRGDKRKIVVSSNLAETSLTVKGVRYVVDSGLICQPEWDSALASGSYPTKPHSQSGVRQRWGRVGRDAPGWVFPLYTAEQFLAMARNTPPGSAQTNLESFYMKLLAAGLDLSDAALPANFRHERVTYDAEGTRVVEAFDSESARAQQALRLTGAVDVDGHLTDYGNDLERFPGTGAESLALMLAEQLACVHEVALALSVLGGGRLFGKNTNCILRVDPLWPAQWRVGAAQRHRALAIGCEDDLDVLLRVYELWQADPKPAEWCATWWINEEALTDAWSTAMESVGAVSAAMKGEASRSVMPVLADRVRAILTRAMVSLRYDRVEGATFRQATATGREPEEVNLRSPLVQPSDAVLAFKRFRLPRASPEERGQAIVSHIVRVAEWVAAAEAGSGELGLDLIIGTASHTDGKSQRTDDVLEDVRIHLPIGTIIDLELSDDEPSGRRIREVATIVRGLPVPFESQDLDDSESDSSQSGFDRDWDPVRLAAVEVPEEELEQQILNPREIELNDVGNENEQPAPPVLAPARPLSLERLRVVSAWPMLSLSTDSRCRIVGYSVLDAIHVALVVEPLSPSTDLLPDPATHPDLRVGDEVDVIVCGEVRDHERSFIQFARADLKGYFALDAMTPGLNPYDLAFLKRLRPGAHLTAVLIPTDRRGVLTPTLLPTVGASLRKAPSVSAAVHGEMAQFYSATIVQGLNEWGKADIELDYGEPEKGISHRFEVRQNHLRFIPDSGSMVGQSVQVALAPSRGRNRTELTFDGKNKKLTAFLASHADVFDVAGNAIRFLKNDVPKPLIRGLAECNASPRWSRDVWQSYVASFHRTVRAARPVPAKRRVSLPTAIISLVRERRRELQDVCGETFRVDQAGAEIEIVASDAASADAAAASMTAIVGLPRAFARVPSGAMGRVVGKEQTNRKALESQPGIRWVWTDRNDVGVVGDTPQAVSKVVEEIRALADSATGELVVPAGKNGYLIGTKGATIDRLKMTTGCKAWNKDRGQLWVIEGPSAAAVNDFISQATQIVGGSGRVTATRKLEVTENTAVKPRSVNPKPVPTPPATPRPARPPRVSTPQPVVRPSRPEAKSSCFIATACYGDAAHEDVVVLRRWRDERLTSTASGRWFARVYADLSPPIAATLARHRRIAVLVRNIVLRPIVSLVRHRCSN